MDALQRDAVRYDTGDVNSSLGVRLDLVSAADDAFLAHPWLGVAVGNFGGYLETTPDFVEEPGAFCRLVTAQPELPDRAARRTSYQKANRGLVRDRSGGG